MLVRDIADQEREVKVEEVRHLEVPKSKVFPIFARPSRTHLGQTVQDGHCLSLGIIGDAVSQLDL
jgi:hypothetical protein